MLKIIIFIAKMYAGKAYVAKRQSEMVRAVIMTLTTVIRYAGRYSLLGSRHTLIMVGMLPKRSAKIPNVIARLGSLVVSHNIMPIAAKTPQAIVDGVKCERLRLFLSESINTMSGPKPSANVITSSQPTPSNSCAVNTIAGASAQKNHVTGFGLARFCMTA